MTSGYRRSERFCLPTLMMLSLVACHGSNSSPATPGGGGVGGTTFGPRFAPTLDRGDQFAFGDARDIDVADIDGDGQSDLLVVNAAGISRVAWGSIEAENAAVASLDSSANARAGASADLDGDGDVDLVLAPDSRGATVWIQTSPRVFERVDSRTPANPSQVSDIAIDDLDGDGDADIICARPDGVRILLNDGVGFFADDAAGLQSRGPATQVATGRLFGAAQPDIATLIESPTGGVTVLRNDGAAVFADATSAIDPGAAWMNASSVRVADVEGDGVDELLVCATDEFLVLSQDGAGNLVLSSRVPAPGASRNMFVVDDDVDGDSDVVIAPMTSGDAPQLFRFDVAQSMFEDVSSSALPGASVIGNGVVRAWGDVDGNGRPDLVLFAAPDTQRVLWQLPSGFYDGRTVVDPLTFRTTSASVEVPVSGDFDGDGDVDIVTTFVDGMTVESIFHENDGAGRFVQRQLTIAAVGSTLAADLDGDGRDDLVGANGWISNVAPGTPLPRSWPTAERGAATVGDFDGDGDLDVIKGATQLLINDGAGNFTAMPVAIGGVSPRLMVARVDNNQIDDLLVLDDDGQMRLLLGDGTGAFADVTNDRLPADSDMITSVVTGDWDGDGDRDLMTARALGSDPRTYGRIYLNDGAGTFGLGDAITVTDDTAMAMDRVFAADYDDDGRAEVFYKVDTGGSVPSQVRPARVDMFEFDPVDGVRQIPGSESGLSDASPVVGAFPLQFVDLDGDLDLDIIGGDVRNNRHRDLSILGTPRFGQELAIRVTDRGFVEGERALVVIGAEPTRLPLFDVGTLLVQPQPAAVVEVDLADEAGRATARFPLRNPAASARSKPVFAQGILIGTDGRIRALTPRDDAVIR